MLTERFYKQRKDELDKVFSKRNIVSVWRKIVKDQLRRTDILDIFDYYDFNYNIEDRAQLLRTDLLNGHYQSSLPLIYRIEKKFGVCRHLVIPQPLDALILQVITEAIRPEILKKQPSENAYYSQDRHSVSKPHEIDAYGYNWQELWKQMQKKIYKFSEDKELLIVSDLANFYDNIEISELRKKITSSVDDKEVLIDILFKIVEKISWLPDYLPYMQRGLPTTNIEGIRLLGHCYLFEIDRYLKDATNNSYTRWMDDVVIGVDSRDSAIEILSSVSDILKSRGLALNLSKTDIYNSEEAEFHFMINENKYLDSIVYADLSKDEISTLGKELKKRFKNHLKQNKRAKHVEKITKRYITAFGKLKSEKLLVDIPDLYEEYPEIRQNLLTYLTSLGYHKHTSNTVLSILKKLRLYDDISLFNVCKLVTNWNIPTDEDSNIFIVEFLSQVTHFSKKRQTPFDFYCVLWVKAKYEHPEKLYNFIIKYDYIWKSHSFLRRMVTAIMARLLIFKEDKVKLFLENQISTGESQIVSLASHIINFSEMSHMEKRLKMYLFPEKAPKTYPLSKFIVLCSTLNSEDCRNNEYVIENIKRCIKDLHMRKWIDYQYDIK